MANDKIYSQWAKKLQKKKDKAPFMMIAEFIADSIDKGALAAKDRLPTVRQLSSILGLNYTTVAKGYAQAREIGLIDSRPGMGTFVKANASIMDNRAGAEQNLQMNSPVSIESKVLIDKMRESASFILEEKNIMSILRYHDVFGGPAIRDAGAYWLKKRIDSACADKIIPCAGIHNGLVALLSFLGKNGAICTPQFFYPGVKAIAQQLNIKILSLESDDEGPLPDALDQACGKTTVSAIYLNPTINNPTTVTMSLARRLELSEVAKKHRIAVIEDDAYGMIPTQALPAFYDLYRERTWYITGMSKCFAPGLRMAWVQAPSAEGLNALSASLRALTLMPNPLTNALASQWIIKGIADAALNEMRKEALTRQDIARRVLNGRKYRADPEGFHLWFELPEDTASHPLHIAAKLQNLGISALSSSEFSIGNPSVNAIRFCLGGDHHRDECETLLRSALQVIDNPTWYSSVTV